MVDFAKPHNIDYGYCQSFITAENSALRNRLIPPKRLEPIRAQLGVSNGVRDVRFPPSNKFPSRFIILEGSFLHSPFRSPIAIRL